LRENGRKASVRVGERKKPPPVFFPKGLKAKRSLSSTPDACPIGCLQAKPVVIGTALSYTHAMDNRDLHICPFCGEQPGNLMMVKIFCSNEECAIFDIPIDLEKWNRRAHAMNSGATEV
jgi:hypothetical protein